MLLFTVLIPRAGECRTQSAQIEGTVLSDSGEPLGYAVIQVAGTNRGVMAGSDGSFVIEGLKPGAYEIRATLVGHESRTMTVQLVAGEAHQVQFILPSEPFYFPGITVTALRPDLEPGVELDKRQVRESNPRDVGEILREVPGLDAVRRGPIGLDPVVRGLRETQVGVYLDGTRIFPGGPGRMDSPLSHFDPSVLRNVEFVTGPYALTWGAGNMSAIRATTQALPPPSVGLWAGSLSAGYDTNVNAYETSGNIHGMEGPVSYQASAAWREGDDYTSGGGLTIPGNFQSGDVRGKLNFSLSQGSNLLFSAGYQDQNDIDYPGRLLNADYFHTLHLKSSWSYERRDGVLRGIEVMAYYNDVDHRMDNQNKPTSVPDPDRMPPFAIDVDVDSRVRVAGGRAAAKLFADGSTEVETGGDLYYSNRDARRFIRRQDTGMLMFEDLMWPDADIVDAGLFVQAKRALGSVAASAAVRVDFVHANADTASPFFLDNTEGPLESNEVNWSGFLTGSVPVGAHWTISGGVGSAVRTADATERYSDRFPSSKAQTSAEFMGNPQLEPERSSQADLWLRFEYPRLSAVVNGYARHIDNYITLESTDLPPRLPMSPPPVYRYINGEAVFVGGEAGVNVVLVQGLNGKLAGAYTWAEDRSVGEPVLGIPPLKIKGGLRYEDPSSSRYYLEAMVTWANDQDRAATSRSETPTSGYSLLDLKGGLKAGRGLGLRAGVLNVTDEDYVNHLNAKNPFTGNQIPEPGRVFFIETTYSF